MPLFELRDRDEIVSLPQLRGGSELYETEIEELLWSNFEALTGEALFLLAKQPHIAGGYADIVALDRNARVVVIEIKRDVDRRQLAQCLEYAGWARTTNLDELARIYHRGRDAFFADWQQFTDSERPVLIRRSARLILVAREFHGRTASAFDFLVEHGLPVKLIRVSLYEDPDGRRFVDIEGELEPDFSPEPADGRVEGNAHTLAAGRQPRLADLVEAGLLQPGQALVWPRPRLGQLYRATLTETPGIRLEDGREFSSPSPAACQAAGIAAYDGWLAWRVGDEGGELLNELRIRLAETNEAP